MKSYFIILSLCLGFLGFSQSGTVTIEGYAPAFLGAEVGIYQIDDYISFKESKIATTQVGNDSLFKVTFSIDETRKIVLRCRQNSGFLYVQPNSSYRIYYPEADKYTAQKMSGNQVEFTLFELDSNDINYKILKFNRYFDENFVRILPYKNSPEKFSKKLDSLSKVVDAYFFNDSSSYFKTYVLYSVAAMDNIQFKGGKTKYEKYAFYLHQFPVYYQNDVYMDYLSDYYEKSMDRLPKEVNNRVYLGLLKSSPTLIMKALDGEVTLSNLRIREIVMLKILSESYYSPDYPQSNILTVIDSVANRSLFAANQIIAKNIYKRLTEVNNGGEAPNFALPTTNGMLTLDNFKKKFLYIQFVDLDNVISLNELELLKELYKKYGNEVEFFTVVRQRDKLSESQLAILNDIPWKKTMVSEDNTIFEKYQINSFPSYVLIDPYAYVVSAPALAPSPNGVYQTIDKTFFEIQKQIRANKSLDNR